MTSVEKLKSVVEDSEQSNWTQSVVKDEGKDSFAEPLQEPAAILSTSVVAMIVAITWFTSVDGAITIPGLYLFMLKVGGNYTEYGIAISAFFVAKIIALAVFGRISDKTNNHRAIFIMGLTFGTLGGLAYTLAGVAHFNGPVLIIVSRMFIGLSGAGSSSANAFLAAHSELKTRTRMLALANSATRLGLLLGPALTLAIVMLPEVQWGWLILDEYTWVGVFLCFVSIILTVMVMICFPSPTYLERLIEEREEWEEESLHRPLLDPTGEHDEESDLTVRTSRSSSRADMPVRPLIASLKVSGAFVCYHLSFCNAFRSTVFTWGLPILSNDLYHWSQVQNSVLYAAVTGVAITGMLSVGMLANYCDVYERSLIFISQVGCQILLGVFVVFYGLCFGHEKLPVWLFITISLIFSGLHNSMIPANKSLYATLSDPNRHGTYQSIQLITLQVARLLAAQWLAFASQHLGACVLYMSLAGLNLTLFVPLVYYWPLLVPGRKALKLWWEGVSTASDPYEKPQGPSRKKPLPPSSHATTTRQRRTTPREAGSLQDT